MDAIEAGQRVQVEPCRVRMSFPKDRTGQLSPQGVRMARTFEGIVDSTGFRPFVTEVRETEVEIASSFYGEDMKTLRIPMTAVMGVVGGEPLAVRGC